MENMRDFLLITRNDRTREKLLYSKKQYLVPDSYRMIRKIRFEREYGTIEVELQVSKQDYHFYLIENEGNAYFSIPEIYDLLNTMSDIEGKEYVSNLLKKQLMETEKESFCYEDIEYEIRKCVIPDRDGKIAVIDGSQKISYEMLFILINLIQEKSSAMFSKSIGNEKYIDGIIRLLVALIECTGNHNVLNEKGWFWNFEDKCYVFSKEKIIERNRKKYYLTKGELDDIISLES